MKTLFAFITKRAIVGLGLWILGSQMVFAQSEKTIFLHYWTGALGGGINEMVDIFNQKNPTIPVKATGFEHESFKISIKVMLDGGNPPDLFSYWSGARTQTLVDKGQLASIDELWHSAKLDKRFAPAIVKASTYNGKKYALPVTQHYVAFFYNKKVFQEHQITPPQTWEELLSISQTFKSKGVVPFALGSREKWPAQFWFDYLLLRTAGPDYRKKLMAGQGAYTDKAVQQAYKLWKEVLDKGYFNPTPNIFDWSEAAKMVAHGDAAMTLMGTWIIGLLDGQMKLTQEKDYDFFEFPIIDPTIPKTAVGPIDSIILPKEAKRPNNAKVALEYFSTIEPQKKMSQGSGAIAPNKNILTSFYTPLQQRIIQAINSTPQWAFNYDLATPPPVAEIGLNGFFQFLQNPNAYQDILVTVEQGVQKAFQSQ